MVKREVMETHVQGSIENDDLETYGPIRSEDKRAFPTKKFLFMSTLTDLFPKADMKLNLQPAELHKLLEEDESKYFILAPAFEFPAFPAQAPVPKFFRITTQKHNFFSKTDPVELIKTMSVIAKRE